MRKEQAYINHELYQLEMAKECALAEAFWQQEWTDS